MKQFGGHRDSRTTRVPRIPNPSSAALVILVVAATLGTALNAEGPRGQQVCPHGKIVATVNGESISCEQLEAVTEKQLAILNDRVRKIRLSALNRLMDNLLIKQAAAKEGMTADHFLRRRIEGETVSDREVEEAYQKSRENFPGVLPAEIYYRVRRGLEDAKRSHAFKLLLEDLRKKSTSRNYLFEDTVENRNLDFTSGTSRGDAEAIVTIAEFADFECPHSRAAQAAIDRVVEKWGNSIRHVFLHFPLDQHPGAFLSARAAVCAEQANRFWQFRRRLFDQPREPTVPVLLELATELGIDRTEFSKCLDSSDTHDQVTQDVLVGRSAGVRGTPTIFVNGQRVSVAELDAVVEREFKRTKRLPDAGSTN